MSAEPGGGSHASRTLSSVETVEAALNEHPIVVRWHAFSSDVTCRCKWKGSAEEHTHHLAAAVIAAMSGEGWRP